MGFPSGTSGLSLATLRVYTRVVAVECQVLILKALGACYKVEDFEDVGILVGFPGGAGGNESANQSRRHKTPGFDPCIKKIPWRRAR